MLALRCARHACVALAPRRAPRALARRVAMASASAVPATELRYFDNTYAFEARAVVQSALDAPSADPSELVVLLDRTIFYPAGGGQPADGGVITAASGAELSVRDVRLKDGVVHHTGVLTTPLQPGAPHPFPPGTEVTLRVDEPRRRLHARIHSAGHLLDVCMSRCGYPPSALVPAKGVHTPAEAYVEYTGKVPPEDTAPLAARLNASLAAAVAAGGAVRAAVLPYDAAAAACGGELPPYIAAGATPRVVTMLPGEAGCPCGGTHVADVAELGRCHVTAIRVKKGTTRISYVVDGMPDAEAAFAAA